MTLRAAIAAADARGMRLRPDAANDAHGWVSCRRCGEPEFEVVVARYAEHPFDCAVCDGDRRWKSLLEPAPVKEGR